MPLRDTILFDGVRYQREDRGLARYRTSGRVRNQKGYCQFHDYKGPDQRCLSVEIYGTEFDQGDLELCVGERIRPEQLTLLAGWSLRVWIISIICIMPLAGGRVSLCCSMGSGLLTDPAFFEQNIDRY